MIKALVTVTLKDGILDPEGRTIRDALPGLGIKGIKSVETGKHFELSFGRLNKEKAHDVTEKACNRLLSNPVIEKYSFEIVEE